MTGLFSIIFPGHVVAVSVLDEVKRIRRKFIIFKYNTAQRILNTSSMEPVKSPSDKRSYRFITLPNKLDVLCVSGTTTK
jgi:hypothetical protein